MAIFKKHQKSMDNLIKSFFKSRFNKKLKIFLIGIFCFTCFITSYYLKNENIILDHKRAAVFAAYNKEGVIPDYVVYYLKNLKTITDVIVFVSDNEIQSSEIKKIKPYITFSITKPHGEYDFGSYKRGFFYLKNKGILNKIDEIIFCNDSTYGPIFPFEDVFNSMKRKQNIDFWGLTVNTEIKPHIQSFFYVFKKNVFLSDSFQNFMSLIKKEMNGWAVTLKYEVEFTAYLKKQGFNYTSFVPLVKKPPHKNPYITVLKYGMPLVKIKLINGFYNEESPIFVMNLIRHFNPQLFSLIIKNQTNGHIYLKKRPYSILFKIKK